MVQGAVILSVILGGECQVVVQRFAIYGLALGPGLRDGGDPLLGRHMHEIDAHARMPGQPDHLAKGYVLGDVGVDKMNVLAAGASLMGQLLEHVLYDVVVLGVYDHDAAVLGHLGHGGPQVAVVHHVGRVATAKGGVYLETGNAASHNVAHLLQRLKWDGAG